MLDVLLIDDDELVRQSLQMLLTHEGFQVEAVAGGAKAISLAQTRSFDLVISDVRMPDLDGFATVARLREHLPDASFVLMTGYAEQDAPVQALRMQVDDFFRKPFDVSLFLERIRQIRRTRRQRRGRSEEHSLEAFIAGLRRLPGYSERTDSLEGAAQQAARRMNLEALDRRALAVAVRLSDLIEPLPVLSELESDEAHNLVERVAQLLGQARLRPLPDDAACQLLAGFLARRAGRPLDGLGLTHEVRAEVLSWIPEGESPESVAHDDPHQIRVVTLGETRVFSSGQEVPLAQWQSARARSLFLFLLSRRPQWVSAERLRDTFWPDSDPDKGQRSLVSSIHRCRKALSDQEVIVRTDRGYTISPECSIWWDFDQMQRALRQARPLLGDAARCLPLLRQVENLCGGDFAPEHQDEWTESVREEARRCTQEGLRALGRLLLESDPAAAEGRVRKVLRIEPTDEAAADILLQALWAQGRRDEGVRFYRDFCARLERELSLPPGPELLKSYLQLSRLS